MIALLQRVSHASVVVGGVSVGAIDAGLLVLLCAERGDTNREADALLAKLLSYRVFSDQADKMNLSLTQVRGGLLLVPQGAAVHAGGRYQVRHPAFVHAGRRTGRRPPPVRLFRAAGARQACIGRDRAVRRRHAGVADQRRSGDFLAAGQAARLKAPDFIGL